MEYARRGNPRIKVLPVSATSGSGRDDRVKPAWAMNKTRNHAMDLALPAKIVDLTGGDRATFSLAKVNETSLASGACGKVGEFCYVGYAPREAAA